MFVVVGFCDVDVVRSGDCVFEGCCVDCYVG